MAKEVKPKPSNPNGANQYLLDPRQSICWGYYTNPRSDTFGNALQSALKAGYEEKYAKQITVSDWFVEKLRRLNMLSKAEKVLDETLQMSAIDVETGKIDVGLQRVKTDVAKHITSTLGKNEGYSTRVEQTGVDGGPIEVNAHNPEHIALAEKYEKELKQGI